MNKAYCNYMGKEIEDKDRKGISPKEWGPKFWDSLFYIAEGYPENNASPTLKLALYNFIQSLQLLLPCSICRRHLCENLQGEFQLDDKILGSKKALKEYFNKLRIFIRNKYGDNKTPINYYCYIGLLLILIILMYKYFNT